MYDGCGTGLFACIMYIIFICQMCHAMDLHASMQVVLQQCPLSISPTWSSRSKSYNISFVTQLYPLHLRHDFSSESQWQTQHRWASTLSEKQHCHVEGSLAPIVDVKAILLWTPVQDLLWRLSTMWIPVAYASTTSTVDVNSYTRWFDGYLICRIILPFS